MPAYILEFINSHYLSIPLGPLHDYIFLAVSRFCEPCGNHLEELSAGTICYEYIAIRLIAMSSLQKEILPENLVCDIPAENLLSSFRVTMNLKNHIFLSFTYKVLFCIQLRT